jgi:hypothetical protein
MKTTISKICRNGPLYLLYFAYGAVSRSYHVVCTSVFIFLNLKQLESVLVTSHYSDLFSLYFFSISEVQKSTSLKQYCSKYVIINSNDNGQISWFFKEFYRFEGKQW